MPMPDWLPTRRSKDGEQTQPADAGMWMKCQKCGEVLYRRDLAANLYVCPKCNYHFRMNAADRIAMIADGDFNEIAIGVNAHDPLGWADRKTYANKLNNDRERSGSTESITCGFTTIGGHKVGLGVMDFHFRGGTMGTVAGERIALLLEESAKRQIPVVIFAASGGARMEEGMLALMQMAKTTAAVSRFTEQGNFFLVVLTDPTTGGVAASFAFQADVIVAESKAMIGFAGRRVIEQTIRQRLPDQFQTAEFLLDKGAIDMVVGRHVLKETVVHLLEYAAHE